MDIESRYNAENYDRALGSAKVIVCEYVDLIKNIHVIFDWFFRYDLEYGAALSRLKYDYIKGHVMY